MVQTERERARRDLLRVGAQLVLHVAPQLGHEAARRGHRPARLQAAQPRRHRAAARIAGDADVALVDLLAGHQIIERADAVPRAPRAEEFVDQELLVARVIVLGGAGPAPRLPVRIHVLHALALADRVEDQHDIAETREPLAERLIRVVALPLAEWPHEPTTPGQREPPSLGNVEVRRHQESRAALENHVLDLVGIALDDFRDARVERRLLGERPERLAIFPRTARTYASASAFVFSAASRSSRCWCSAFSRATKNSWTIRGKRFSAANGGVPAAGAACAA